MVDLLAIVSTLETTRHIPDTVIKLLGLQQRLS